MSMAKLEFKNMECSTIITCICEDGAIDDLDEIKKEIKDGFETILDDIVISRNNVIHFEVGDVVLSSNGSDKTD